MHSAPAVNFPVGRCRFECWVVGALLAFGALVCALWINQTERVGWRQLTALSIWLVCVTFLLTAWGKSPIGHLVWRQEGWLWVPGNLGGVAHEIQVTDAAVHLDLQFIMLLELTFEDGQTQWLWLEKNRLPERWLDIRRAVHAPRSVYL